MAGGIIQLVAIGIQDIEIICNPQITLFKVVYRRHTNFSIEPIIQRFTEKPDFGKKVTCLISRKGDLMSNTTLVIKLPKINVKTEFAWIKKIGYGLIKNIDIEINNELIDRHYGHFLNIWFELTTDNKNSHFNEMIGNVPELYNFSQTKDEYILYIPLQFWFCKSPHLSIPLIALQFSDVKIHLEINEFDFCHLSVPTNFIFIEDDIVTFEKYEYIEQVVNNELAAGIFIDYDIIQKKLFYSRVTQNQFKSLQLDDCECFCENDKIDILFDKCNKEFLINGKKSSVMPKFNQKNTYYCKEKLRDISLVDCYLIIDYIYIDSDERCKFVNSKNDYVIETLSFSRDLTINSPNKIISIDFQQPSKLLFWTTQYNYLLEKYNNDLFNYTDSYKYFYTPKHYFQIGKSLVNQENILFDKEDRLSYRDSLYFNNVQPYQYFEYPSSTGVNIYSFSLFPDELPPSGTANMTQIGFIDIKMNLNKNITVNNSVLFRCYSLSYNILRIYAGYAGKVFSSKIN
jgi:hypothetical protein